MSLATRCTSCETVFRVVQDQLKVSEGWVRCGRCDAVFNALESLFDLDYEARSNPAPTALAPTGAAPDSAWPTPELANAADVDVDADARVGVTTAVAADLATDVGVAAGVAASVDSHGHRAAGNFEPVWTEPEWTPEPDVPAASLAAHSGALAPVATHLDALASTDPKPDPQAGANPRFLRATPRRAGRLTTPWRLLLAASAAALLLGGAGQALYHFRDAVAAHWPQTLPLLTAWCKATGCVIAPVRHIDDVVVESTALTRTAEADTFTLAVGLRNRGALRVALPSLDVTLTDSDGQLVARRAFAPADFPAAAPTLAAGTDTLLNITLATGSPRVSGYTIEIFYP